jgi:hypothetical protein
MANQEKRWTSDFTALSDRHNEANVSLIFRLCTEQIYFPKYYSPFGILDKCPVILHLFNFTSNTCDIFETTLVPISSLSAAFSVLPCFGLVTRYNRFPRVVWTRGNSTGLFKNRNSERKWGYSSISISAISISVFAPSPSYGISNIKG